MNAPSLQSSPLMRAIALFLLSFAIGVPAASSADLPELEKLRASYKAAVARGTKSILQSHITTLEKLRDIYARGGNPQGAAKVQADIDRANVAMSTGEFLPPAGDANNVSAAELQKLRTGHDANMERAVKPYRETYARELEKLRDQYTRAANLEGANTIAAELAEAAPTNAANPALGAERFFAGKSWHTPANSEFRFKRDGTGERVDVTRFKTPFTWRKMDTGIIEVTGTLAPGAPTTIWYFKFDNNRTALMGNKIDTLDWPCRPDK